MEPYFRSLKLELTHLLAGWPKTEALKGQRNINLKKAFEARYKPANHDTCSQQNKLLHCAPRSGGYHARGNCETYYGRWQQRFVEGEKAKFDVGLN
jgi:hypothetical protein